MQTTPQFNSASGRRPMETKNRKGGEYSRPRALRATYIDNRAIARARTQPRPADTEGKAHLPRKIREPEFRKPPPRELDRITERSRIESLRRKPIFLRGAAGRQRRRDASRESMSRDKPTLRYKPSCPVSKSMKTKRARTAPRGWRHKFAREQHLQEGATMLHPPASRWGGKNILHGTRMRPIESFFILARLLTSSFSFSLALRLYFVTW